MTDDKHNKTSAKDVPSTIELLDAALRQKIANLSAKPGTVAQKVKAEHFPTILETVSFPFKFLSQKVRSTFGTEADEFKAIKAPAAKQSASHLENNEQPPPFIELLDAAARQEIENLSVMPPAKPHRVRIEHIPSIAEQLTADYSDISHRIENKIGSEFDEIFPAKTPVVKKQGLNLIKKK